MRVVPPSLAIALVLTVALVGCAGAGGTPAGESDRAPGASDSSSGGEDTSPTACVIGTWAADVDDLAAQLGSVLADRGMEVVTTRAAGTQTMTLTGEGGFSFANDVVVAVDVQISDGPTMTVAQSHVGTTTASWGWDASSTRPAMMFTDYDDSDYVVENTVAIEGVTSTTPIDVPPLVDTSGRLFVTCTADELVTTWEDGLFITSWTRG